MRNQITHSNGDDAPEASATIYLCQPLPRHKRAACCACGDSSFGEPWIRFFLQADPDAPVCKKCAMKHGFTIVRQPGEQRLWCRRAENGAIIISEEPDRDLDDRLDRWLTGFETEDDTDDE